MFLEYRIGKETTPRRASLYDPSTISDRIAPAVGPSIRSARLRPRPQRVEINQPLPLSLLEHGDGSPPGEGDVILLAVCADDFDDVALEKQPGRSHEIEIRIVGRNALEIVLNQEQAAIQQELLRLREKEREALKKVTEVENRLKKMEKLNPDDEEKLLQAEQLQQQIREQRRQRQGGSAFAGEAHSQRTEGQRHGGGPPPRSA